MIVEFVETKKGGNNGTISTKRKGDSLFSRDRSKARMCGRSRGAINLANTLIVVLLLK